MSADRGHASLELVRELFGLRDDTAAEEQPSSELAQVHDLRAPGRGRRRREG
jgi:hypothetical protein